MTRLADIAPRPLLFLDVDGVLNCPGPRQGEHEHHLVSHDTWTEPLFIPHGTRERIRRLLGNFEPVWATAWLGRAHGCWAPLLGLDGPTWPYVSYRNFKLPEVIRHARGRPWAFVDDDARWEMRELGWTDDMVPGLVLAPLPAEGLTDEHVERLLAWAAGEREGLVRP